MSRIALIDNATLTASQRLLGTIKVKNLYNIDGDIAAFEGLLQAILFFDEVRAIDDYKEEYRTSRHQQFEFIQFMSKEDFEYETLLNEAKTSTAKVMFSIRGREIDDEEFRGFFDMLKIHLVFNWQMSSSVFYLTTNLLANDSGISNEKYGTLQAMISSQLWGENESPSSGNIPVKDRAGNRLKSSFVRDKEYGIDSQMQRFAAALNWLSLKLLFMFIPQRPMVWMWFYILSDMLFC